MIGLEASLADFNAALSALDKKLGHHGLSIEIRAIGGYAMLYNKLRIGGYTMDVDTATRDISPEVMEFVREVAEEKRLDEDWINNDSYILPEVVDIIDKLKWQKDDSFDNIDLYVADIGSLLILKTRAVEYGGLAPRIT
ncbi:MAG: hypothetical protein II782_06110, partial [Oscillospiraceae bacterium]|nr:hypothetical protein [Oscillospiraceae bacterium]